MQAESCAALIPAPQLPATYCSWHGVTCCSAVGVPPGCPRANVPYSLNVNLNKLNGSMSDPAVFLPILSLYECGLRELDLENNKLSGRLVKEVGRAQEVTRT